MIFPAAAFDAVKAKVPDPRRFLQDLMPSRANYESTGASATYDDPAHAVRLAMTLRGAVRNAGGGRWEFPLEGNVTLLKTSAPDAARAAAWFREKGTWEGGIAYTAEYTYGLPAGATQARFDARTKVLSWRLPPVTGTEAPRVSLDLRARDRLMSTIYKVYGLGSDATTLFWVAKAVFRNEGGPARNLRVRYRLGQYGDWSPWSKHPELAPGQTVVDVHYPVLDPSIAKLRSNTPANLLVEYSYEDGAGRRYEDDASRKVVILGVNEYVFGNLTAGESFGTWEEEYNNAPLLAAWVTRNDPVVKQFAAMANRMAGGVGATSDQASAERVLRACYELLQRNDFSYQHPPALLDKSVSFDAKTIQNVKLPRETIRDRSGTCIDLAILYAAMINALGLEPHLALIPGHCFPVIRMPDKKLYAVEVTGVQGGLRTGSADFDRVYAYGLEELQKAVADGRIYLLDLHELWTKGIANPEIEDLPPDILQRWGINEEGRGGPTPGPGPGTPTPPAGGDVAAVVGTWGGPMGGFKMDDELVLDELYVGVDGPPAWKAGVRLELTFTRAGVAKKIRLNGLYEGAQVGGGAVRFPRSKLKRTDVAAGTESQIEFYALTLRPGADGRLDGAFEGDGGFTFKLLAKTDPAAPTEVPEALAAVAGSWGGSMGAHDIGQGTLLDEMYVDAAPGDGGFTADVKMKVRLSQKDHLAVEIDVACTGGQVDGDVLRFAKVPWRRTVPSTGQKDEIEGNPLTLQVLPDGRLKGVFEGADGLPFTLLRRGEPPAEPPTSPLADLAGTWGGSLGKARINDTLAIPEALVTFAPSRDGTWSGSVDLRFTVTTPNGPVDVRVQGAYPPGRAEGDAILFPAASLERVVVATGERSPMDGNPMELRREPDGRLEVKFTGDDGFALTLTRATGQTPPARTPPARTPAPPVRLDPKAEACIGRWGGRIDQATPDGFFVETFTTEVKRTGAGVYEATQQIVIRLTVSGRTDRLTVTGAFRGPAGGQGLVLASTSRRRTLASSGVTEEIGAGTLEVHVEDGKLTGRVGNATDGYTPFSLIPAR